MARGGSDRLLVMLGDHRVASVHIGAERAGRQAGGRLGNHQLLAGLRLLDRGAAGHAQIL